ncbi:MAG: amino acid permease [Cutibacterium avidum]|uniref:Amino acid transporter n=1 Tax=Cutibacterium avidum TaxID=33010 RepID=A0A3E2DEE9_9ACTN|nr:amino acid permease [Cutibacterium avidum]MBS5745300.1 amino acid permease [Propionibacterium sp.]MDK7359639.1 amino acid permease [Cutibacterium avidum]MDK7373508.1 amino acid permease [Cutibacterium avidum]MDU3219348.1 amino acid permease [Cutibacterium avidum]MDU3726926.1 amino acid permease [Cutibacterium avidum]
MATQTTGVTQTSTDPAGCKPRMKGRHLVMMSLGSAIGTGLFVGSGKGVAAAGPATLVAYVVAGLLVIAIMYMLGEMVAAHPDSGAFSVYTSRAMGPAAGFAMGWVWWIELVIVVAAEAIAAASTLVAMWPIAPVWLLTLIFLVVLTAVNLLGVDRFGEFEFWFALLKVAAVLVFLVIGVLLICGVLAAPAAGASNLVGHGGFMPNGWSGIAAALLMVTFSFGGIEIMAVAAAETEDPARNVSRAVRTIVWRILLFYMGSVAIMVIAVPWDDPKLGTSPFVAVLDRAGIPAASEVMTLVIVLALLSSLNANLYGAARMLGSLAERGMAPRAAMRTRGRSVPAMAVLASVLFGFCCVLATFWWGDTVLGTLLNIVGSTIIVTYFFTICSQYVLRRQVEREGTPLPMRIKGFPVVSWAAMILLVSIMVLGMFAPDVRAQLLSTGALVVVLYLVGIAWSLHDGRSPFRPTTD